MKIRLRYVIEFYLTVGIPLFYLLILYLVSLEGTLNLPMGIRITGLVFTLIGIILWTLSYLTLGHSFGVLPRIQSRVKNGVYARFKHPMYLGITLTFFGIALANNSQWGVSSTILLLVPVLFVRAKMEEKKLL